MTHYPPSYSEKDSYRQTPISKHPAVRKGTTPKKEKPIEAPVC